MSAGQKGVKFAANVFGGRDKGPLLGDKGFDKGRVGIPRFRGFARGEKGFAPFSIGGTGEAADVGFFSTTCSITIVNTNRTKVRTNLTTTQLNYSAIMFAVGVS